MSNKISTTKKAVTDDLARKAQQLRTEALVNDIHKDFEQRQAMRRPYELSWQLNMNFMMGNQYCTVSGRGDIEQEDKYFFWQERQVFNHIAPIVETRVSKLSKVRPRPVVRPFSNADSDVFSAKMSTKILDSTTERLALSTLIQQATMWSEVCGTVFYKVTWGSGKTISYNGNNIALGDVNITVCPPFEIYPDSNVNQSIADCQSVIHARAYSVEDIKRLWGVDIAGGRVRVFAIDGTSVIGGLGYNSTISGITHETKNNHALVIERYTRPNSQYPQGRLEIVAGNQLLYEGDLPYVLGEEGERDFPFVRQMAFGHAGCFWGSSVVDRCIPVQRAYNALKNRKHEFINRLSMGVLTVEDGSVDTDNLEEEGLSPGKILVYRQGATPPCMMDCGSVPVDFQYEEDRLLNEFTAVSGVSEFAFQSTAPANINSGTALQQLSNQDDNRMAVSTDSIREAVRVIAKYVLRLYKQYAHSGYLAKIADNKGNVEAFYFNSNDIASTDVVFETENELANSITQRRNLVMELLSKGVLTDADGNLPQTTKARILEMLGLGNWENAQDITQLHISRAQQENIAIGSADVLPIDDHRLHITEHTRFVIGGEAFKLGQQAYVQKVLQHIEQHQNTMEAQNGKGQQI